MRWSPSMTLSTPVSIPAIVETTSLARTDSLVSPHGADMA
jgi:hypothetical protein